MFKKIDDELAAGIFCFVWEFFMYVAIIVEMATGSNAGWYIFLIDTAVQITILYYDTKLDRAKKQLKRTRNNLANMSANYTEYVRSHSHLEEDTDEPATVIEMSQYINGKKVSKKIKKKAG